MRHAPPHVNAFPVALLVFVCVVAPEPVAMLIRQGSVQTCSLLQVVDAMRQTIKNYTGGLPHEFFEVSISAKGEDLAQLMYTMMMSGFMFRNAQYRLELRDSMLPAGMSLRQCMTYCLHHHICLIFAVCTFPHRHQLAAHTSIPVINCIVAQSYVQVTKALMSMICLQPCQSWGCLITARMASMHQDHKSHVSVAKC